MFKAESEPAAHVELGAGAVAMARLDRQVNCTVPSPTTRQKKEKNSIMERYNIQLALKPCITFLLCPVQKPITILMTLGYKNSTLWLSMLYPCQ